MDADTLRVLRESSDTDARQDADVCLTDAAFVVVVFVVTPTFDARVCWSSLQEAAPAFSPHGYHRLQRGRFR